MLECSDVAICMRSFGTPFQSYDHCQQNYMRINAAQSGLCQASNRFDDNNVTIMLNRQSVPTQCCPLARLFMQTHGQAFCDALYGSLLEMLLFSSAWPFPEAPTVQGCHRLSEHDIGLPRSVCLEVLLRSQKSLDPCLNCNLEDPPGLATICHLCPVFKTHLAVAKWAAMMR